MAGAIVGGSVGFLPQAGTAIGATLGAGAGGALGASTGSFVGGGSLLVSL